MSKIELLDVSFAVFIAVSQVRACAIHVERVVNIIRDSDVDGKLFLSLVFSTREHHDIVGSIIGSISDSNYMRRKAHEFFFAYICT